MRIARFACRISVAALALGACTTPVHAQDGNSGSADKRIESLRQCRAISEPGARLACYEAAGAELVAAADRGELRIMDKEAVQKTKRRLFGFALPDLGLFGDDDEPEMDMLETTITTVQNLGRSDWAFSTPEGGIWRIDNAPFSFRDPKPGDKVVFKRAALGSYFIRINDRLGVKGRRVE